MQYYAQINTSSLTKDVMSYLVSKTSIGGIIQLEMGIAQNVCIYVAKFRIVKRLNVVEIIANGGRMANVMMKRS